MMKSIYRIYTQDPEAPCVTISLLVFLVFFTAEKNVKYI
jgi:hypothetical protein